jgi:hypothetical protein
VISFASASGSLTSRLVSAPPSKPPSDPLIWVSALVSSTPSRSFSLGPGASLSSLGPTSKMVHQPGNVLAEGDVVITEHKEVWHFPTGEVIVHPFTSVMEIRNGKICRWHDYSHLGNLLDNAPQWWLEYIMSGGTTPIPS